MSHPGKIEDCAKISLENPSHWSIQGYSKAGDKTGFMLHPLKIMLDAGMTTSQIPHAIVMTHSHCDHSLNLPTILTGRQRPVKGQEGLCGKPVYLPESCLQPIQRLMEGVILLSDNDTGNENPYVNFKNPEEIHRRQGYHPIVVKSYQKIKIPGIKNIEMEILPAYHNTESVGYGFSSLKNKLKPELHKLGKEGIIAARKRGEEINIEVTIPEVLFFCDSKIDNFTKHDEWQKYPVIMAECTGFPEKHTIESMTAKFHTHLLQLEPVMERFKDKQWILTHTSSSLKNDDLEKEETRLREKGINVCFVRQ